MTHEQTAAYVIGQAALLNARVAQMQAVNTYRDRRGETIAYGEEEFEAAIREYEGVLGHNGLVTLFGEATP